MERFNLDVEEVKSAFVDVRFNRVEESEFRIELWYTYDEGEDYVLEVDMEQDEIGVLIAGIKVGVSVDHSKIMEIVEEIENYKLNDDVEWVQKGI